jgi:hypothetical protein
MRNAHTHIGALKVYVCLAAVLSGWQGGQSASYGAWEALAFAALFMVAVLSLLDAVINDILPEPYNAPLAARYRYVSFILLAGAQLSVLHAAVLADQPTLVLIRYALDAAAAVSVAVLDLGFRRRNAENQHLNDQLPA